MLKMSAAVVVLYSYSFMELIPVRKGLSWFTLTWLVWESIITFSDEYDNIWRFELWPTKSTYLFMRYFTLISQIINHGLTIHFLSLPYIPPWTCRWWFGYQSLVVQFLYNAVEFLQMRRVYALYDQSTTISVFLKILYAAEFIVMSIVWFHSFHSYQFDPTCLLERPPRFIALMNITIITVQSIVWGMIYHKRNINGRKGTGRSLIQISLRDGAVAWVAMVAFFSSVTPYMYLVKALTHSMFQLVMTLVSVIGCRMILNIQDAQFPEEIIEFELETVFIETSSDETTQINSEIDSSTPCEIQRCTWRYN